MFKLCGRCWGLLQTSPSPGSEANQVLRWARAALGAGSYGFLSQCTTWHDMAMACHRITSSGFQHSWLGQKLQHEVFRIDCRKSETEEFNSRNPRTTTSWMAWLMTSTHTTCCGSLLKNIDLPCACLTYSNIFKCHGSMPFRLPVVKVLPLGVLSRPLQGALSLSSSARRRSGPTSRSRRTIPRWLKTPSMRDTSDLPQHTGVSENSVPLNPMVNDHYPY